MNRRCLRLWTMLMVVTFLLGACVQTPVAPSISQPAVAADQAPGAEQTRPAASAVPVEAAGAETMVVVGTDNDAALVFVPRTVEAPANTLVTLTFNNTSTQPHNLQIPPPIKGKTKIIAAGASETITFTTPAAGSYKFFCTLHHYMIGTLQVK
jgi:plastocyanin